MITQHSSCCLKNGEIMTIEIIEPPIPGANPSTAAQFNESYNEYPVHFGWTDVGPQILRGEYVAWSRDRFFVGKIGGEVVGNVLLHSPADTNDLGLIMHVMTKSRHQGKGIISALLQAVYHVFANEGGMMLYLPTGSPVAARAYRKIGFVNHIGCGMRCLLPGNENFDESYFAPAGKVSIRKATWGDFSRFVALFNNTKLDGFVRFYAPFVELRAVAGFTFHRQYRWLFTELESGTGQLLVLENQKKRVVGVASLNRMPFYHEQHIGVLNFLVLPGYQNEAGELLEEIVNESATKGIDLVHAYISAIDHQKKEILIQSGFTEEACLKEHFRLEDSSRYDLLIYARHLAKNATFIMPPHKYYGGTPEYLLSEKNKAGEDVK